MQLGAGGGQHDGLLPCYVFVVPCSMLFVCVPIKCPNVILCRAGCAPPHFALGQPHKEVSDIGSMLLYQKRYSIFRFSCLFHVF